jgi:hypothetical protein
MSKGIPYGKYMKIYEPKDYACPTIHLYERGRHVTHHLSRLVTGTTSVKRGRGWFNGQR